MLRPSYAELMDVLNKDPNLDDKVTSRYAIVIAASKRARQLIDGAKPLTESEAHKAVSTAVKEMNLGLVTINPKGDPKPSIEDDLHEYLQDEFDLDLDKDDLPELLEEIKARYELDSDE